VDVLPVLAQHAREAGLAGQEDWQVLIVEHHAGYIDWESYEHNQRVIADNTNMRGSILRRHAHSWRSR
jgi:hypothetical protein